MDMLESIGTVVLEISRKMEPERIWRIEDRINEITKSIDTLVSLGMVAVFLLALTLWRVW